MNKVRLWFCIVLFVPNNVGCEKISLEHELESFRYITRSLTGNAFANLQTTKYFLLQLFELFQSYFYAMKMFSIIPSELQKPASYPSELIESLANVAAILQNGILYILQKRS